MAVNHGKAAATASAQGTTPRAGDVALGASVSTSANTVFVFYHINDRLIIAPQIGFYYRNIADTAGSTTTNYPATWFDLGIGLYYALISFEGLSVHIGPSVEFATEAYQNEGSTDNLQFTYWNVDLNARILAMITRSLGVFTTVGLYFYSQDTKDTTTSADSSRTGIGIQSVSLGVTYYFK